MVQSSDLPNQELLKNMVDNNMRRGRYVYRMVRKVPTKYMRIGLAVYMRIHGGESGKRVNWAHIMS